MMLSNPGLLFTGRFDFFFFIIDSISLLLIYSDYLFLPDSVLESCMFLGIYPFLLGCPTH